MNGATAVDYDGDGDVDVFVPGRAERGDANRLLRNEGSFNFTELSGSPLATTALSGDGAAWADVDNDGDLDVLIATTANQTDAFFRNDAGGFTPLELGASITGFAANDYGAIWGDYDNDGWVDLYSGHWSVHPPRLFRNQGALNFSETGTFPGATLAESGSQSWADFDGDGDLDLVLSGGTPGLRLVRNLGKGQFQIQTPAAFLPQSANSSGVSFGDYDNDGDLDLFAVFYNEPDRLYRNDAGTFNRVQDPALDNHDGSPGNMAWGDLDNDGDLDVVGQQTGGGIFFLRNNGSSGFSRESLPGSGIPTSFFTGIVPADLDNDGDLDLLTTGLDVAQPILENTGNPAGWLRVRTIGRASNRAAIGAKVRTLARIDGRDVWQLREISGGFGYGLQGPLEAHFGLGDATNVTTLRVEWPSGKVEEFSNIATNQFLTVTESSLVLKRTTLALAVGARGAFEALPGTNRLTYQWRFQGADLPGETNRVLGFPNVTPGQAGDYILRATSTDGVVELTAHLDVVSTLNGGLVADYHLDGNGLDAGPNGLHGSLSGPTATTDRFGFDGQALFFNGAGAEVVIPDSPNWYLGAGNFTLVLWARLQSAGNFALVTQYTENLGASQFGFTAYDGYYYFHTVWSGTSQVGTALTPPPGLFAGQWKQIGVIRNGSSIRFILDGQVFPGDNPTTSGPLNDPSEPIRIGGRGHRDLWFHGAMDGLRFWNRSLTDTEVAALFASESPEWMAFTLQPVGGTFPAGQTVNLSVQASGVGSFTYQWFRDGQTLPGATNATLTLANAHPVQSGDYTVVVSNAGGSVTSQPASVQVNPVYQFTRQLAGAIATDVSNAQEAQWVDYDHDGDLDLFVVSVNQQNLLYRNDGSGEFSRMNAGALTQDTATWQSAAWGDYDGDGDLDVAMAVPGGSINLFRQNADHGFTRLAPPPLNGASGNLTGISWVDVDRDGALDLFQLNNLGQPYLFRGNGTGGFTASSALAGLIPAPNYGGAWADYDGNGFPDLYVATYENALPALLRNRGPGGFIQDATGAIVTEDGRSTTAAWADYDNDGDLDLAVGNFDAAAVNTPVLLYRNEGGGAFTRVSGANFPQHPRRVYGLSWGDLDNDGDQDLYVACNQENSDLLYYNNGNGTFTLLNGIGEFGALVNSGGESTSPNWVDFDEDGRLDLSVANAVGNLFLFRNDSLGLGNWLEVRALNAAGVEELGVVIRATANLGGGSIVQRRDLNGGGFHSTEPLRAHFGLGEATTVTTLRVEWPSGRVTELLDVTVNQVLTVNELPAGTPVVRVNGRLSLNHRHEFLTHDPVSVGVRSSFPNVFYTIDGSPADFTSTPYTDAVEVAPPATIHAIAYDADFAQSAEAAPVELVFLDSFAITHSTPGGGGIVFDPFLPAHPSNSIVRVTATNAPGWSFLRWEGDLSGTNPSNALTMDGPKSLRAVFGTPLGTAVTGGAANGSVILDPTNNVVPFGNTSRLMAIPAAGKYFVRWALAGNPITTLTNSPLAFSVTNPAPSLTALFGNLPVGNRSLTLRVEGAGTIARNPAAAYYTNNASVTLTAVPEPGWTLDSWSGDLAGSLNPQVVSFDANKSVTARFRYTGVIDPPLIVAEPSDAARIVGQSVSFTVGVTGSAPLGYQWYFGSQPIEAASLASLTLGPLSLGQSGGYSVVISNPIGAITSRVAQLTVSPPPNIPPSVAWIAPSASASFRSPTNIVLQATASDSDGSVQRVEFLLNGAVLGSVVSSGPNYSFTWTNAPAGTHTLASRAVDNQNATALSASVELTVLPPLVTSFAWEYAAYSETERDGVLQLKVIKSGAGSGSVFFETVSRDAVVRKDYLNVSARLDFSALETEKFVEIPLINEYMPDGSKVFEVRLSDPSLGTVLGFPSVTEVTLLDDDGALENSSFLGFFPSSSRLGLPGQLQLHTEPLVAAGQWRLPWDARWRNTTDTVTNLDPGPYTVEYRPAAGYLAPPASEHLVFSNAVTRATNFYTADPLQGVGTLRVDLFPLAALLADGVPSWRLVGDAIWLASGQVRSNIAPGTQAIEFRTVDGWATPGSFTVLVQAQVDSSFGIEYRRAGSPPVGAAPPVSLPSYDEIRSGQQLSQRHPYPMAGQIRTPAGWASGVVVRDRVVLTAAHVLFDGSTNLVDPSSIEWFHERHAGVAGYSPRPIRAKGYYYHTNYLAARTVESQQPGWIPGSSTPASQEWDVAVLFFDEPVARGGQSGYLLSDATPNLWLGSSREKELVGYPITGANDGRMHTTRAGNYTFGLVPGSTRVYASSGFFSFPGNSGGPLCVLFDRAPVGSPSDPIFFPAAVYLGNYDGQSIVRAIDSVAASLINRAASAAQTGENFLDGGPVRGAPILGGLARFGQIRVRLQPDAARAAAAGWRFTNTMEYLPDGQAITLAAGPVRLYFKPLAGFRTPAPRDLSIVGNLTNEVSVVYEPYGLSFPPIADRVIAEGTLLSIVLGATHEAVPPPPLTYRVVGDLPTGAGVTNGVFGWVPGEDQGPSTNEVSVAVSDGVSSVTNRFTVIVTEVNVAPLLAAVSDQAVDELTALNLTLSATDDDLPVQMLIFSRVSGPEGLAVSATGIVTWTPTTAQRPSTNDVTVQVTDGIAPVTRSFRVIALGRTVVTESALLSAFTLLESGSLRFDVSGTTGVRYVIESSPDLFQWTPIFTNAAPFQFTMPTGTQDGGAFLRAVSR